VTAEDAIRSYLEHHFPGARINMAVTPIIIDWPGAGRYELSFEPGILRGVPAERLGAALTVIGLASVMKLKGPRPWSN
jgi:hypothetical protein